MHFVEVILLAAAISVDALGAGLTYGLRRIRVPACAALLVAVTSLVGTAASALVGSTAGGWLTPRLAEQIGGLILVAMGLWIGWEGIRDRRRNNVAIGADLLLSLRVRPLGVMIQVMRCPEIADVDRSGQLGAGEAVLLGSALALDTFGAGLAAGLGGGSWITVAMAVGLMTLCGFAGGTALGQRVPEAWGGVWLRVAPGVILTIMGLASII
ncbi:MAG: sporulation membrane protein YtaF [Firmicutes bacterium]|nr:sporulation membrane protein YtaF [Bacillota bacterium]